MSNTDEELQEFISIIEAQYGRRPSKEEAAHILEKLIWLYELISKRPPQPTGDEPPHYVRKRK